MRRALILSLLFASSALAQTKVGVDRYGEPLPPGARERLGSLAFRHDGRVSNLAVSPQGNRFASWAYQDLLVWDAKTGRRIGTIQKLQTARYASWDQVAFSPDGSLLLVARDGRNVVEIYDAKTVKPLRRLTKGAQKHRVSSLGFTKTGRLRVIAYDAMREWDPKTGRSLRLVVTEELVHGSVFSPDDAWMLSTYLEKGRIRLFDTARCDVQRHLKGFHDAERPKGYDHGTLHAAAFSPDGKHLVVVGQLSRRMKQVGRIQLYDVATGKLRHEEPCQAREVAFAPDGKQIVTLEDARALQAWNLKGERGRRIDTGGYAAGFASWRSGIVFGKGNTLRTVALPITDATKTRGPRGHESLYEVALTPDGKQLYSTGGGELRLWSLADGRELRRKAFGLPTGLAVSPDGKWLVVEDHAPDGKRGSLKTKSVVFVLAAKTWEEQARFTRRFNGHYEIGFSPNGKWLAIGDRDRVTRIDTATWKPVGALKGRYGTLTFTPDGESLVLTDRKGLRWLGLETRRVERELPHKGALGIAYAKDGKRYAVWTPKTLEILEAASGTVLLDLSKRYNKNYGLDVQFAPDGRAILVSGTLIDAATGKALRTFASKSEGKVTEAVFTKDGELITGMYGGTILIWDLKGTRTPRTKGVESPLGD